MKMPSIRKDTLLVVNRLIKVKDNFPAAHHFQNCVAIWMHIQLQNRTRSHILNVIQRIACETGVIN